ncbi:hypothetical protein CC14983A_1309 [Campylobacter coli]|uniref:hypothetical protein n=1 Tax=Campylobacter coli TaxID=195 RepID=UPI000707A95D|nr:hypothetical protein [Campylobacter coli]AOH50396.1 hypothetical protein CC14983A_1309 [Campylobacter coli]EAH4923712.1 hypothetical protein [Campylobacter coli]EAH8507480.1 hypothetical protein [Campylobacter coli]EAH9175838.1 hypothetical protein [Campylobacter coli]EAI0020485.1 hypothetical protein [Campylobacter coli]
MTSVLLSQSLHAISIGGKYEFFANKDLSIPVINTNKALNASKKYYLIFECEFVKSFSYKSATQGRGIFVDDKLFTTVVSTRSGTKGQKITYQGWVKGSKIKHVNLDKSWTYSPASQNHIKTTKFELYYN